MDRIIIEGLEVFSRHGVRSEERALGQKFLLSMELFCDISEAGKKDELGLTLDYGKVCSFATRFMTENTYYLIEAAAEKLCRALLLEFAPRLEGVSLTLKKPWAPVGLPLESCGVSIERHWHRAFISAGSNLGDRRERLENGIRAFRDHELCRVGAVSSVIETAAYGKTDQPDFLNLAFEVKTLLTPAELLGLCARTENEQERVRKEHWGPRTLDLDIVFYDEEIIYSKEPSLIIPHPDMQNRQFVLEPLCEIAPGFVHPVFCRSLAQLFAQLKEKG